ncbi:MAG: helix-turn-helix domain-containing protein [Polyangiales bacterium]
MGNTALRSGLFPAQLKYWRNQRGLSQLDFSLVAEVSARHISFLETGRASPSRDMVLRLGAALAVPLRDQNRLLRAAGFDAHFDEETPSVPAIVRDVLTRMMKQHEPYPMVVVDRCYNLVEMNQGASALITRFVSDPGAATPPLNLLHMLFDPRLSRPFVQDWETLAGFLLSRVHQELLLRGDDAELRSLLGELLSFEDVPEDWRQPDFATGGDPVFMTRLKRDEYALAFASTLTHFSGPQAVMLEELRIESFFPLDDETEAFCEGLRDSSSRAST